jgi:arylsulfatase A-like enzyme
VLVVIDTLRRDHVSPYNRAAVTPHLEALAAEGQVFSRALAAFHQTSMSMAALFTGHTPSLDRGRLEQALPWNGTTWCGLQRLRQPGSEDPLCIPRGVRTLAGRLREAGYWTIGVASNELLYEPSGYSRGFDDWLEVGMHGRGALRIPREGANRTRTFRQVLPAVEQALERRPRDRLFLYVHLMDAHDYAWSAAAPEGLQEAYRRGVARADRAVGLLLGLLEQRGLREGSVVLVTSDHGERLGERHAVEGLPNHRGNPSFQTVLEVPLIVAPAVFDDPGRLVRGQDLHRLILELAGAEPVPAGELGPGELLLGERFYRTYLAGRFKTVVRRRDAAAALFDLEMDPEERRDVAESHPDVQRRHLARMEDLSRALAAGRPTRGTLSESDRARLRALGYLEED